MKCAIITPVGREDPQDVAVFYERIHRSRHSIIWIPITDLYTSQECVEAVWYNPQHVQLLTKVGLAACYRAGYKQALETDADIIVEMDIGHPILELSTILWEFRCSYPSPPDVVMAYRKKNYSPWSRRLVTWLGNHLCQGVLRMPYRDCTGGYIAMRREVVEMLDLHRAHGHGHQVELKKQLAKLQVSFREFPITQPRGPSSFTWASIWDGVRCLVS